MYMLFLQGKLNTTPKAEEVVKLHNLSKHTQTLNLRSALPMCLFWRVKVKDQLQTITVMPIRGITSDMSGISMLVACTDSKRLITSKPG